MYPVNQTVSFTSWDVKFFIDSSLREVISEGNRTISFNDLVKGDDLLDDFTRLANDYYHHISNLGTLDKFEAMDAYIDSHRSNALKENTISSLRIKYGMSAGLIDLNTEALILTDDGWKTHKGKIVADSNASIDEIKSVASNYTTILPTVTHSDLSAFSRVGKIVVDGNVIAERLKKSVTDSEYDEWYIHDSGRTMMGDPKRVLHHQNVPFYLTNDNKDYSNNLYHGSLVREDEVDSIQLDDPIEKTYGASQPGNGIYLAGLNEAVKVYSNGISLERVSLKEYVVDNIDKSYTNENRNGVVFKAEVSNNLSTYNADYNSEISVNTSVAKPSPYVFLALINKDKPKMAEHIKARALSELSCAENPFEVYRCIERLSGEMEGDKTNSSIIPNVFASMGYDSVRIAPPTPEQRQKLAEINQKIINDPEQLIDDLKNQCKCHPKAILNKFRNYSQFLLNGTSGLIDKHHVIIYQQGNYRGNLRASVKFTDKLVLPRNEYFKTKSFDDIGNDPVFSKENGKNYDLWDLRKLQKYVEGRVKSSELDTVINYR